MTEREYIEKVCSLRDRMLALGVRLYNGDKTLAEDLVQEVLADCWVKKETYDWKRATHATWVFQKMYSKFLDERRSSKRHRFTNLDEDTLRKMFGIDENIQYNLTRAETDRIISQYRDKDKKILLLLEQGWKYEEIAEKVGMTTDSVKDRVWRLRSRNREARAKLDRKYLNRSSWRPGDLKT